MATRPKKPVHNVHNGVNQLRIIGGECGSRKLSFPNRQAAPYPGPGS